MKQDQSDTEILQRYTAEQMPEYVRSRLQELSASDHQFREAMPLPEINEAKNKPGLELAQIMAICLEGYAERPALGHRATQLATDPETGRNCLQILDHFETITYAELWSRVRNLASFWYNDPDRHLRAGELLCILAFSGADFTTVDMAATHNGAVTVPMQTNGQPQQLLEIVREVEPRWLATSLECLPTAVNLVLNGFQPTGLLLFDYHPEVDSEREIYERSRTQLAEAGLPGLLVTLESACDQGSTFPRAPLYDEPGADKRVSTIYYTSGSTGLPKGAMYRESTVKTHWQMAAVFPFLYLHYMPMNHGFGRTGVAWTLSLGGTCYFTAKSDLSMIFDDIKLVRPTFMGIVPRVCEMIYQQYKLELARRIPKTTNREKLENDLIQEVRVNLLGGRFMGASGGSAPLAPELRTFIQNCLGFPLDDMYGATEIGAVVRNTRVMRPPVIDYKLVDVPELGYFKTDKPHPRGELLIKTGHVMMGYYKRPELTASVFNDEGYYKTGDIMAEIGPDQLVYVDRRNNVLKLSQGEFVAISRLEALFTNGHQLIYQAYLYGTSDRSYLVGVLVPSKDTLSEMGITGDDKAVRSALREAINDVAHRESLHAYEVPRDFLVEYEPFSIENDLLAGIGKYRRPKFVERYGERLEAIYETIADSQERELERLRKDGRDLPVLEAVGLAVQATLGINDLDLSQRCNFSELGGDSLTALSCSMLLEDIYGTEIPASVINNPSGSLQQLAHYIERALDTSFDLPTFASVHGRDAVAIHASDLTLEKFIDGKTLLAAQDLPGLNPDIRTVLLTGANGYLGRFLCLEWLERMAKVDGKVICLVRGEDENRARKRLADAFVSGDQALEERFGSLAASHLEVLAGDLGEPGFDLDETIWQRLAGTVDHIVHPAAFVNHVLPYPQLFGPNVVGTAEVIRLAISHHLKSVDNVSTLGAALIPEGGVMTEDDDVRTATPVRQLNIDSYASGYALSKWAGEVLLRDANDRLGLPVSVFRCDMILAHSVYRGQLNVPDVFTRWLFSTVVTGLAPRSYYESAAKTRPHYDGLPVDFTAAAIARLGEKTREGYRTYHVINPHDDGISLDSFVDWAIKAGYSIQRIDDYDDWLKRFEAALRALPEKQRQRSSLPLLHQLNTPSPAKAGGMASAERFESDVRTFGVGQYQGIPHLSADLIRKYLDDLGHLGLLEP